MNLLSSPAPGLDGWLTPGSGNLPGSLPTQPAPQPLPRDPGTSGGNPSGAQAPLWVGRFQLLSFRTLGTHLLAQTQMAKPKPAGGKNSIPESFQWSRPPAQLQGGERVEGLTLSDLSQGQCPGARTPLSHPGPWFLCVLQTCHRHAVPLASSSGGTDLELGSAFRKAQLESQLCHLTAV